MKTLIEALNEGKSDKYAQIVEKTVAQVENANFIVSSIKLMNASSDFEGNASGTFAIKGLVHEQKVTFSLSYSVWFDGKQNTIRVSTQGSSIKLAQSKETKYGNVGDRMILGNNLPAVVREVLVKSLGI